MSRARGHRCTARAGPGGHVDTGAHGGARALMHERTGACAVTPHAQGREATHTGAHAHPRRSAGTHHAS
eukprot:6214203-Pleurochrysis_carterae.AAC.2